MAISDSTQGEYSLLHQLDNHSEGLLTPESGANENLIGSAASLEVTAASLSGSDMSQVGAAHSTQGLMHRPLHTGPRTSDLEDTGMHRTVTPSFRGTRCSFNTVTLFKALTSDSHCRLISKLLGENEI